MQSTYGSVDNVKNLPLCRAKKKKISNNITLSKFRLKKNWHIIDNVIINHALIWLESLHMGTSSLSHFIRFHLCPWMHILLQQVVTTTDLSMNYPPVLVPGPALPLVWWGGRVPDSPHCPASRRPGRLPTSRRGWSTWCRGDAISRRWWETAALQPAAEALR